MQTRPKLIPKTANVQAPLAGSTPATATQTAGPGAPGSSGGFAALTQGNGGFHNPPENPALNPTPSTTAPSSGTPVFQNGSGLTGGQNQPPMNTANATSRPFPVQKLKLGFANLIK